MKLMISLNRSATRALKPDWKSNSCAAFTSLGDCFDKTEWTRWQIELTVPVWCSVSIEPDFGYLYLIMQPIENKFITKKTDRACPPRKSEWRVPKRCKTRREPKIPLKTKNGTGSSSLWPHRTLSARAKTGICSRLCCQIVWNQELASFIFIYRFLLVCFQFLKLAGIIFA